MSETEESSIREEVIKLQTNQSADREEMRRMAAAIEHVAVKVDAALNRATNWPMLIALAMLLFSLLGGGWQLIRMQTELTVAEQKAIVLTMDARVRAESAEVETQFDSLAQSQDTQFAEQQRRNADLQNALHDLGAKMPAAPAGPWYFPNISSRRGK